MSMSKILILASIAAGYSLWYLYCVREERKKREEQAKRNLQRGALGFRPEIGENRLIRASGSNFAKRCPRGVCTNPGASCPRECVEAPIVKRLVDGRLVHEYDNVEIIFDSSGEILEVKVDGLPWS